MSLIPGSGRSPGEENGNPLQCSCLGNSWTEESGGLQSLGHKGSGATEQQNIGSTILCSFSLTLSTFAAKVFVILCSPNPVHRRR